MKYFFLFACFLFMNGMLQAQHMQSLDTIHGPEGQTQVWVKPMYQDSLASSFVIVIPVEVKLHKHAAHSEHVYILEGEGIMVFGDKKFKVQKGDLIFIPKGTPHAVHVTSMAPMKVLSIQAPHFDGKDRIVVKE